jgi:hypothetical protein
MTTYDRGDLFRFGNPSQDTETAPFANLAGTATDPTAVLLTVVKPDGTSTVYAWPTPGVGQSALMRESAGRFYADVLFDQSGKWLWYLAGTGAVTSASEGSVRVQRSKVLP